MIKKFNEFIEEGFMTRSLGRKKSFGSTRMEDKHPFDDYYKEIKWIDLGHPKYLFAEFDYPIKYPDDVKHDGTFYMTKKKLLLSINELFKILKNLPNDVLVLNETALNWLKRKCSFRSVPVDNDKQSCIKCTGPNEQEIYFDSLIGSSKYVLELKPHKSFITNEECCNIKEITYSSNSKSYFSQPKYSLSYNSKINYNPEISTLWDSKQFSIKLIKIKSKG